MITLYIIRGLPGTGKSTLGKTLANEGLSFADTALSSRMPLCDQSLEETWPCVARR